MTVAEAWLGVFHEWDRYLADPTGYGEVVATATEHRGLSGSSAAMMAVAAWRRSVLFERPMDEMAWPGGCTGDVLVGFRNAGPLSTRVALYADRLRLSDQELPAGGGVLALAGNCLPSCCLCYTRVRLVCPCLPQARVVMAFLPPEARTGLATGVWDVSGFAVARGCVNHELAAGLPLRPLPGAWRLQAEAKRRLQATYLQELMAAACRPARLRQILDAEELEAYGRT